MDDPTLLDTFGRAAVLEADWTHRAHLRIAWLHLGLHSLDVAHVLVRVGIIRLNAAQGLVETPTRGYHETLTRVWLCLVASLRKSHPHETSGAFVDACAEALTSAAVLRHYSRDRIMSVEARARFVEPDLSPLPSIA